MLSGATLLGSIALVTAAVAAGSARYSAAELAGPNGLHANPLAITNDGQIAGSMDSGLKDASGTPVYWAYYRDSHHFTQTFSFQNGVSAYAYGVNSHGVIVGERDGGANGAGQAFIIDVPNQLAFTDLDGVLRAQQESHAYGVNDAGTVVGRVDGRAFVWSAAGGAIDLGPGTATAINNQGEVVGQLVSLDLAHRQVVTTPFYFKDTNGNHAVDPGELIRLGTLGDNQNNWATAINDAGTIVGEAQDTVGAPNGNVHAVKWDHAQADLAPTDLGSLTAAGGQSRGISYATGINAAGQIVGVSNFQPFLWQNGQMTGLQSQISASAGWVLSSANGINDSGAIVGRGQLVSNSSDLRGVLLTPGGSTPPPPANVQLLSLRVTPSKARPGKPVTASIAVSAKLTSTIQVPLTFTYNGQLVNLPFPVVVTLKAGQKGGSLRFTLPTTFAAGSYTVTGTYNGTAKTAAFTVVPH